MYSGGKPESEEGPAGKKQLPTFNGIPLQPINQIIPEGEQGAIFIGDVDAAKDLPLLRSLRIGAVLTVALNAGVGYTKRDNVLHRVIPALDEEDYDLSRHFQQSARFIEQARNQTNVLVHCLAGVSRSTTIVIAYLMQKYSWDTRKAYNLVKSRRRLTCPNMGFCQQLKNYQKQLKSDKSTLPTYDSYDHYAYSTREEPDYPAPRPSQQYISLQATPNRHEVESRPSRSEYNYPVYESRNEHHSPRDSYRPVQHHYWGPSPSQPQISSSQLKQMQYSQYSAQPYPRAASPPRQREMQELARSQANMRASRSPSRYQPATRKLLSPTKNYKPFQFADYSRPILGSTSRLSPPSRLRGPEGGNFQTARESMFRTRMLFQDIQRSRNFSLEQLS